MMMDSQFACKVCCNAYGNTAYTAREMMYGLRDEFRYYECGNCSCLQIAEFPQDMSRYYPDDYYSFKTYSGEAFQGWAGWLKRQQYMISVFPKNSVGRAIKRLVGIRYYDIFSGLKVDRNTSILDVGCGNGRSFLYPLAEIGFSNVVGCDPFIHAPMTYKNGLNIHKAGIAEMQGKWDIITYHHSFEHVPDPQDQLKHVFTKLNDGGVCIIRIPTASSYAWQHYRTNWAQLDAPRHFFLHSRKSIKILASQAGLRLTDVVYDSTHFQFSGSEKYLNDTPLTRPRIKGPLPFLKRKLNKWKFERWAKKLNEEGMGDQAAFFLRK